MVLDCLPPVAAGCVTAKSVDRDAGGHLGFLWPPLGSHPLRLGGHCGGQNPVHAERSTPALCWTKDRRSGTHGKPAVSRYSRGEQESCEISVSSCCRQNRK